MMIIVMTNDFARELLESRGREVASKLERADGLTHEHPARAGSGNPGSEVGREFVSQCGRQFERRDKGD
jgi:hypothetical protein